MCGSLQLSASERLTVSPGLLLPKKYIIKPSLKAHVLGLPFSGHRFMRSEKLDWWGDKTLLQPALIRSTGIYEQGKYFALPIGYAMKAMIHKDIMEGTNKWVISILTCESTSNGCSAMVTAFNKRIAEVHHRVPVLDVA